MPLPLIPALLLGASALAGGKGLYDTGVATRKRSAAVAARRRAEEELDRAAERVDRRVETTREALGRLLAVRVGALSRLDEVVEWLEAGRVEDVEFEVAPDVTVTELNAWASRGKDASIAVADLIKSVGAGLGTKALTTAAVAAFGKAGTGAAISGLSGVAARNATLAWLGGGTLAAGGGGMALGATVLSSLNVGTAILGVGLTARKLAANYEAAVGDYVASVRVEGARLQSLCRVLDTVERRAGQLRRSLNAVAHAVERLLTDGDPRSPRDRAAMIALARTLGRLARYRVVDEAWRLVDGWTNPYLELDRVHLARSDDDYVPPEDP